MSALAVHVDARHHATSGTAEPALRVVPPAPAPPVAPWWRWLAAWAALAPGGGLAYHLMTRGDE